jgi:hypothetical protein
MADPPHAYLTKAGPMLEHFTVATFAPHLGEAFSVRATEQVALTLTLSEATALGPAPSADGPRRAPFSLLFHGPPTPILPQRIYHLEHPAIGAFDLFLVPLGPDRAGMRYEAIFG